MRAKRMPKMWLYLAESVNELADHIDHATPVPHHTPSDALWWLSALAREQPKAWLSPQTAALLSEAGARHLRALGVTVAQP